MAKPDVNDSVKFIDIKVLSKNCLENIPIHLGQTTSLYGGYEIAIRDRIEPISEFWDMLANGEIFMSSKYLRALELSPLKNIKYQYGIVAKDGKNIGIIYWQIDKFRLSDNLNIHNHSNLIKDRLMTFVKKIGARLINDNLLVVGNVSLTGDYGYRFCPTISQDEQIQIVHASCQELISHFRLEGIKVKTTMIKDFALDEDGVTSSFTHDAYLPYSADPTMVFHVKPEWKTFDDYLASLKSKARVRVRRAKKLGGEFVVKSLSLEDIRDLNDKIYRLYRKIASFSSFNLFTLHPEYFIEMKDALGDHFDIFGVFLDDEFVAFYTTVIDGEVMHGHFLGYEQSLNAKHQIYLNMLFWLIERAISSQVSHLELSRTALEIKSSVGAEPKELSVYVHAQSTLLNRAMKVVVPYFIPDNAWKPRSPYKVID